MATGVDAVGVLSVLDDSGNILSGEGGVPCVPSVPSVTSTSDALPESAIIPQLRQQSYGPKRY